MTRRNRVYRKQQGGRASWVLQGRTGFGREKVRDGLGREGSPCECDREEVHASSSLEEQDLVANCEHDGRNKQGKEKKWKSIKQLNYVKERVGGECCWCWD